MRTLSLYHVVLQLLVLLKLVIASGSEAREMNMNMNMNMNDHVHPSKESLFFRFEDMKPGNRLPFYFQKRTPESAYRFLPRAKAEEIPFSSKQLPYLLRLFSVALGSQEATDMADTLKACEAGPFAGETRFCATSAESLLESVTATFGITDQSDRPTVFTSTFRSNNLDNVHQNYTVLEAPREISASQMIGCHSFAYPYTVFFCHAQDSETNGYHIYLRGDNGDEVDAISVCHMDTSEWIPTHRSFIELGSKPGDPVCHFFPAHENLLWVHATKPHRSSRAAN